MKKLLISLFVICYLSFVISQSDAAKPPAAREEAGYGKLTVYSDVQGSDIYVDAKFVGQDRATISNIPVGKHYVRVVKDDKTIQSGLVDVKEGEETIIVAKLAEEELLSRIRKPNQLLFLGSYTSVGYNFSPSFLGISSFSYKPQFGLGVELKYPIPAIDFNVNIGFLLNYPSILSFYDTNTSQWSEGRVSISSPYVSVSREFLKLGQMRVEGCGGLNYALYTPGGGVQLSIEPRLGYMFYLEGSRSFEKAQRLIVKAGYVVYLGKTSGDISSPGYFLQAGVAYQL